MNAYLMSAGVAIRLRPLTEKFPKCLLRVGGTEMLDIWITSCLQAKAFSKIFVNIHHCPEMMNSWLEKYKKKATRIFGREAAESVRVIDETSKLLGTAGTLFWHADTSEDFFMVYTDTFSKKVFSELGEMCRSWRDNPDNPIAGLLTFNLPKDGSAGAIDADFMGTVNSFTEKAGRGLIGWAGMMFARKEFLNELTMDDKDLARNVFPRLCGRIRVMAHIDAYDIGRGIEEYEHIKSAS